MSFTGIGNFGKYQGHFCCVGDEWEISTSKHTQRVYFHVIQPLSSYLQPLCKNRFLKILDFCHFCSFLAIFYCILLYFKVSMIKKGKITKVLQHERLLYLNPICCKKVLLLLDWILPLGAVASCFLILSFCATLLGPWIYFHYSNVL